MTGCWSCSHNSERDKCRFVRLPKRPTLRRKWLFNIRKYASPTKVAYICTCHFVNGDTSTVPKIFHHVQVKQFGPHYCSPEKGRKRRKRLFPSPDKIELRSQDEVPSTSTTVDVPSTSTTVDVPSTSTTIDASTSTTDDIAAPSSVEMEVENYFLNEELKLLKSLTPKFNIETLDDKHVLLYTGLPERKVFDALYILVEDIEIKYISKFTVVKLSKKEQLFIALMKLRQNFPYEDLALRFGVSRTTVSNVVLTWIYVLHEALYKTFMSSIPPRGKNKTCLPNAFSTFTNCRIILDCTEIYTAVPRKSLTHQRLTYSAYKHRNTLKGLVGVAPNGVVTFVSKLYSGSTSDKKIVELSGIINQFESGDLILADKGFLIRDLLPENVHLNIPPFLSAPQFTKAQVQQTERIARARIHVERAIRRLKCFKILQFLPEKFIKHATVIFQTVGALTNLQYPLIKEIEEFYDTEA